jgi:hypothetical protein
MSRARRTCILRDVGLRTTSFGRSASGVLAALGGVLMKGGMMLGGTLPTTVPSDKGGAVAVAGIAGSIPAARNFSSKEAGSGTEEEEEIVGARVLKEDWV